ncbi:hypothetical protein [Leptospira fluminis]|uniref:hypothetical protein n=1 Tax=Leptospira fluminis TaxID=2484979 RepID=UPI0014390C76|nr:hypothetical protein [Leptospira fluminis]
MAAACSPGCFGFAESRSSNAILFSFPESHSKSSVEQALHISHGEKIAFIEEEKYIL